MDVLVEELIICELKVVEAMNPVWEAQLLSTLTHKYGDVFKSVQVQSLRGAAEAIPI